MKIDLNELEALARAATPGGWDSEGVAVRAAIDRTVAVSRFPQMLGAVALKEAKRNAQYIAAANPAAVLELIAFARQADTIHIPVLTGAELVARFPLPGAAVQRINLSHGSYVERETKTTGEPGWLLCAPDGTAVRGLNAYEAEFIDSALRAASAPTQPVQQPAPPVQRWQDRYNHGVGSPAKIECMRLEIEDWRALFAATAPATSVQPFQQRVQPWMMACFGAEISADTKERNHRFFEESTELVQACGMTPSETHQLVDYVYGRPVGEPAQEVGGVMVTLAALCLANGLDMHQAAEVELARIWTKVESIRAKQAAKPKHSPLPAPPNAEAPIEAALAAFCDREGYPSDGPMDGVLRKAFAAGASFAFAWKGGA